MPVDPAGLLLLLLPLQVLLQSCGRRLSACQLAWHHWKQQTQPWQPSSPTLSWTPKVRDFLRRQVMTAVLWGSASSHFTPCTSNAKAVASQHVAGSRDKPQHRPQQAEA